MNVFRLDRRGFLKAVCAGVGVTAGLPVESSAAERKRREPNIKIMKKQNPANQITSGQMFDPRMLPKE
jgi:hypothetical protein